jgi:hypothetical protein
MGFVIVPALLAMLLPLVKGRDVFHVRAASQHVPPSHNVCEVFHGNLSAHHSFYVPIMLVPRACDVS